MAKQRIYTAGEDDWRRIARSVKYTERAARRSAYRPRRWPNDAGAASGSSGSGGGNCGCCDLTNCATSVISGGDICPTGPGLWQIDFGDLSCGCDSGDDNNGEGNTVDLHFVSAESDHDLWRSTPKLICPTNLLPFDQVCESDALLPGDATIAYNGEGDPTWTLTQNNCGPGYVPSFQFVGSNVGDTSSAVGGGGWLQNDTVNWPCIWKDCLDDSDGHVNYTCSNMTAGSGGDVTWDQDASQPGCSHSAPSAYSGSGTVTGGLRSPYIGAKFPAQCDDCGPTTAYGWWELRIYDTKTDGLNDTRLEFKVGGCVVMSYRPVRPEWCCRCEQGMELVPGCAPFACENVPSKICIKPAEDTETTLIEWPWDKFQTGSGQPPCNCDDDFGSHDADNPYFIPRYLYMHFSGSPSVATITLTFTGWVETSSGLWQPVWYYKLQDGDFPPCFPSYTFHSGAVQVKLNPEPADPVSTFSGTDGSAGTCGLVQLFANFFVLNPGGSGSTWCYPSFTRFTSEPPCSWSLDPFDAGFGTFSELGYDITVDTTP